MKFWFVYLFFAATCLIASNAVAQVDLFPKHLGQIYLAKKMLNPAMLNLEQATNATFGNSFFTGSFRAISNFCFIGSVNLNRQDSARYVHSIGLKFVNEKAGEFVERPKYYASYSFRVRLNDAYWLGLGIDVGRAAYIFNGTDVSTSGSASNWDGNIGFVLHNSGFYLGGSTNQFFNSLIAPKDLYFRWRRYHTLYAEKKIDFAILEWSFFAQNQFLPDQKNVLDVGTNLTMANVFLIGTNLWVGRSVCFLAGFRNISLDDHYFSLYMSYNVPAFNQTGANIQSFEVTLYYQFR